MAGTRLLERLYAPGRLALSLLLSPRFRVYPGKTPVGGFRRPDLLTATAEVSMTQDTMGEFQNEHEGTPEPTAPHQAIAVPLAADDSLSLRITIEFERQPGAATLGHSLRSSGGGGLDQKQPGRDLPVGARSTEGGGLEQKQPGDSRTNPMKPRE